MGAGLSMASVNKIKELANSREYSLALELVEHQDLTKSLNPQFLRLCGEIYIQNDRYVDARRCLIMAHRLGPESKRIMFVFVELYLRMGYFELAKTYYDMYMFDATKSDSRQMEYIWMKHEHPQDYESMERLLDIYSHNLDYDWSFELYLLYKKAGKEKEAKILADLYRATYKNSENSECIDRMERGTTSVDELFDLYAREACADDREEEETLRIEEKELLEADNLRMHPKEAEITVMYEDALTPAESEKKVQKLLKKQDKEEERKEKKLLKKQKQQEKKIEKQNAKSALEEAKPEPEAESGEEAKPEPEAESGKEEAKPEDVDVEKSETVPVTQEEKTEPNPEADNMDEISNEKRKGFFHRLFRKKKNEEDELSGETVTEQKSDKKINDEVDTSSDSEIKQEIVEQTAEHSTIEQTVEHANAQQIENNIDTKIAERTEDMGQNRKTIANNVVIVEDDDDFEAQADTVEELAAKSKEEKKLTSPEKDEKPAFEFQTMELAPEDFDDQYEVDDFTEKLDDEFGEMNAYESKSETVEEEPEVIEEEIKEEPEAVEEETEEEPEAVEAEPEVIEEETEEEPEAVEVEPEVIEEETEEEPEVIEEEIKEEPEAVEAEPEVIEEETEEEPETVEAEPETVEEEPEVVEAELETVEAEPGVIEEEPETVEEEPGVIEEELETVEEEPEVIEEEPETVEEDSEAIEEEPEFHVAPFTTKPKKKKLDFPEFKSSLFPDYHKEMKEVENNFDEIMEEAQDKMTENMRKEAQMQKEAEALLASLGISLDSIPTPKTVQKETQPEQKGPSRDELKASLKIDTNKKNLLKQIKEYR